MSIFPVRLSEWYPPGDEHFETVVSILQCWRCYACGKKARYKSVIGHHSLPWGHGDIWCSQRCFDSDKTFTPDKRQRRKIRRLVKGFDTWLAKASAYVS